MSSSSSHKLLVDTWLKLSADKIAAHLSSHMTNDGDDFWRRLATSDRHWLRCLAISSKVSNRRVDGSYEPLSDNLTIISRDIPLLRTFILLYQVMDWPPWTTTPPITPSEDSDQSARTTRPDGVSSVALKLRPRELTPYLSSFFACDLDYVDDVVHLLESTERAVWTRQTHESFSFIRNVLCISEVWSTVRKLDSSPGLDTGWRRTTDCRPFH